MRFFYVNRHKFGFQISGFVKRYNFSRSDIADEFGAAKSTRASSLISTPTAPATMI